MTANCPHGVGELGKNGDKDHATTFKSSTEFGYTDGPTTILPTPARAGAKW
tara:strand:+ start:1173 stop:1325 length:153 start_codon:yes stop_codon:yes gene_type:complete